MQICTAPGATSIRQGAEGRYCLNDLHHAAGGEDRHRPSRWAENHQTIELAHEVSKAGIPALVLIKGGAAPGTYVAKELVYAYAMWISPSFHLKVIRAYDAMVVPSATPVARRPGLISS
jgi:anti-repressor protein